MLWLRSGDKIMPTKPLSTQSPSDRALPTELVDKLDELFPKGKCKERGQAMVFLAYAVMHYKSQKAQWDRDAEKRNQRLILEAHIEELEMTLRMKGKMLLHGQLIDAASVEDDPDVIHPSLLEVRLGALKAELTSLNKGEQ